MSAASRLAPIHAQRGTNTATCSACVWCHITFGSPFLSTTVDTERVELFLPESERSPANAGLVSAVSIVEGPPTGKDCTSGKTGCNFFGPRTVLWKITLPSSSASNETVTTLAFRRMFDRFEQGLLGMGLSKLMTSDSKPAGATDKPKKNPSLR